MRQGMIHIYSGNGRGKSPAALGSAVQAASRGEKVLFIQFLKGKDLEATAFLKKMEPEIKFFRFEKSEDDFKNLSENQKKEEIQNIKNGMNFAKKVLCTGECDLLVLDEVLGLIDNEIITLAELEALLSCKTENVTVIMTGIHLTDGICRLADNVSKIEDIKHEV